MSFLHSIVSFQLGWLIASLAIILGASLLVLWISTFLGRRWFVTINKSEETELMALYLSRIADALERLAATPQSQTHPSTDMSRPKPVSMSIFGR